MDCRKARQGYRQAVWYSSQWVLTTFQCICAERKKTKRQLENNTKYRRFLFKVEEILSIFTVRRLDRVMAKIPSLLSFASKNRGEPSPVTGGIPIQEEI